MNSVLNLTSSERAQLYQAASQKLGIGAVVIEKDFWVCWVLKQLFSIPVIGEHLIFKGGTSLSKAYQAIERFSEDIDLSLSREWLGFSGETNPELAASNKKRRAGIENLQAACIKKITSEIFPALQKNAQIALGNDGWNLTIDSGDSQTLHFGYPTAIEKWSSENYIRREVKIEFGARSDAWPADNKTIRPYVADAIESIADANVAVKTLSVERTFWEKATILHAEAHRDISKEFPARYSRHYSDLASLFVHESRDRALARDDLLVRVVEHKQAFFESSWANYETAVRGTFRILPSNARLDALGKDYHDMREMFFKTPLPWGEVVERLRSIEKAINKT